MRLSTQTEGIFREFGAEKGIELFAKAGFNTLDFTLFSYTEDSPLFSDDYKAEVEKILTLAKAHGVLFNQSHAKFPSHKFDDEAYNAMIIPRLIREIEISGMLGAECIVIHPITRATDPKNVSFRRNIDFYKSLEPYARDAGVKIALENMFWRDKVADAIRPGACGTGEDFVEMFETLASDNFTCLLDIGHMGLVGEDVCTTIRALGGKRLTALHVHDNKFKNDDHTMPYMGGNDWDRITQALADINYKGDFTFEADNFFNKMPREMKFPALCMMHSVGEILISMIEEKMKKEEVMNNV